MIGRWTGCLGLMLGCLATSAYSEEFHWRPAAGGTSLPSTPGSARSPSATLGHPVASLGRPVASNNSSSVTQSPSTPNEQRGEQPREIASCGFPNTPAVIDNQVRPVSFGAGSSSLVVRGFGADDAAASHPILSRPLAVVAREEAYNQGAVPESTDRIHPVPSGTGDSNVFGSTSECDGNVVCPHCPMSTCGDDCGSCYGDLCATCCDPCLCCPNTGADPYRFWIRGEYLLWNLKASTLPPLVTTGPQSSLGTLGQPGTSVLFGGKQDHDELSGFRFTTGMWFDPCQCCGIEGGFFFIGPRSNRFSASSAGDPVLARPIISGLTGAQGVEQVANLGQIIGGRTVLPLGGSISVYDKSQFYGAEINGLFNLCQGCYNRLDLLAGFRYLNLTESIGVTEDLLVPSDPTTIAAGLAGVHFVVNDRFATRNQFYGGQLGLRDSWFWRRWQFDATGKLALGATRQIVDISGSTGITVPGSGTIVSPGGLLAQPTNIGHYARDRFTFAPEVGLNASYWLTNHVRAMVGYNFIYWSNVVRPEDQIDRRINPTQVPRFGGSSSTLAGPALPAFPFKDTDFWAYGLSAGLEFRY